MTHKMNSESDFLYMGVLVLSATDFYVSLLSSLSVFTALNFSGNGSVNCIFF